MSELVNVSIDETTELVTVTITEDTVSAGDMRAEVYDPQAIAADAFDRANHTGTQLLASISDAGTAAALDVGTDADNIVQLDEFAKLPPVDGSQLINLPGSSAAVDSVNGFVGHVILDADDIDDTSTANKFTTAVDIAKLAGIEAGADVSPVVSVNAQTGAVVLDADDISDTSTTKKFTTASDILKLSGIQAGAEVNVNADWSAVSGDALILNKPALGTAAAADTVDFATAAQGSLADTAVQPAAIADFETTTQLNARDAVNRNRANHTGTQPLSTISDAGTAAALNVGTSANQIVQLDGSAKLPAVDGSQLLNLPGGGGAVDSVNGQTGAVVLDADDISDAATTNKFTTASDISKLAGIQAGAEVNVNADWNAVSGDAQILNKPTLGTAASASTTDFATAAQGTLADSSLQPDDIGVTVQAFGDYATNTALTNGLATKEPTIAAGTTSQYWRGDKSWQTLDKNAVGLGNVVNADTTTTANIADSTNKRFVTDASLTVLGNTSGTNTGNVTLNQNGFSFVSLSGQALTLQAITQSEVTGLTTSLDGKLNTNGNNGAITYTNFTPSTAPAYQEGRVWYDSDSKALSFYDDHPGTSIQIGKELIIDGRNNTGSQINNGQVVYISGATGQHPTIALARANAAGTSQDIGLATHNIANNTVGKVTIIGMVNDLDTSAFTDGAALYVSAATAGELTSTPPASPNFVAFVGYVAHAHPTQGKILVLDERTIANNNSLGTSQSMSPTENAVKTYVDATTGAVATQIDQSGGTSDTYGVLVGAVNGSNTDFTVSQGVYGSGKLAVYLNGQLQTQGTGEDWIELVPASGTFRFNTAPEATSLITVEYGKVLSSTATLLANKVDRTGDRGIVLAAGGTDPGTAPLKLTEQASTLTSVEPGAFELVGHSLQFSKYLKRRAIAMSQNIRIADTTVTNTVTESASLLTAEHGDNYLEAGFSEEMVLQGYLTQRSNSAAFGTFRIKYAGVTIQTIVTPASVAMTNVPFALTITFTCRSVGVSGTARIDALMATGSSVALDPGAGSLTTINTTTAQDTTVTFQWNEANAANSLLLTQGRVLCLDQNR